MIKLRKGKPPFVALKLGEDAYIRVRTATQNDVEYVTAKVTPLIMGLLADSESAGPVLAEVMGDDFSLGALKDDARVNAAAARLTDIYLVLACQDGWGGICDEGGEPIAAPCELSLAQLLADPVLRKKIMGVVEAGLHEEIKEKNGSAALPTGEAGIPTGAPTADAAVTPAPADGSSTETTAGDGAPKSNSLH
jgi:hypothetical protein